MTADYRTLMDTLSAETEATETEVDALRAAAFGQPGDAAVSIALVRRLPASGPDEIAALRARVEGGRRRWLPWVVLAAGATGGGGLLAAAVALVVLWGAARPGEAPALLAAHLAADDGAVVAAAPGVALRLDGSGDLAGTADAPRIEWTAGVIGVEVAPDEGIALSVVTREAVVRVVGTAFTVERDALGTRVAVARGKVEVRCVSGDSARLGAGDERTCVPITAPGLLARANQLKKSGARPSAVLDAVRAGLPVATGPFRAELLAVEAEMLLLSGDEREAWSAADAYLELGGARRLEVLQIAASAALAVDGCAGARRYLEALEEAGAGDPSQLARCE